MMKECEEKRNQDDTESESDVEEKPKPKRPTRKPKPKAPARIKPSFYYVSSSEDEAGMLKDRFWKDLEDGKVDIFRTADLYSTVKAIGRSARPKSLAESDLRRSGLRSASNQLRETDQAVDPNKGKSKGKKNKKGAGKTGADRSSRSVTPKSRSGTVSVNLGVKVDHNLSSAVRGDRSLSDDEEDVASTSTRSSGRVETELKSKKKKKRKKKEEGEEEEEEEEEETATFRPKKTKSKWMNLVEVVAPKKKRKDEQEEDSDVEEDDEDDEDEDESESVVKVRGEDTTGAKNEEKTKKVNENDEEKDEDDNDAEADDHRRPKKKKETRLKKKKNSVSGKDDYDDDDDGEDVAGDDFDDDQEEEEDGDDDAEKMTKRKKRKAHIPASKPNKKKKLEHDDDKEKEEEEDESEEMPPQRKPEKEKKFKTKAPGTEFDLDMVRQHIEEAIESVIAQSASIFENRQGEDGGIQISKKDETLGDNDFKTSKVEDPESKQAAQKEKTGKKKKKRKEREEEDDDDDNGAASRIATSSKTKKYTDSVIDYYFSEEESETEGVGARSTKKRNKVNNRAKKNKEKDSSEALGASLDVTEVTSVEEERCAEKDLEEKDPVSCNDVKAIATNDEKEQSKKDLSVSETITSSGATAAAFDETGDHPPDLKEESENGEPADDDNKEKAGTGDAAAVEDTSLDHLVFNLMKVESVDPSDEIDSYAEWNIKVLTDEDLYKAVKFNDFSLVEAMMREAHQFDLEQVDPLSGLTLTMIATLNYSMEIVEMLVLNGANVNARAKDGHSALTLACDKGLHCAASLLLCLGANIGCQLPTGETALILAVKKNHYHVARVLLDHGVNIGASGVSERHALSLARQLSHQPIVELLTTHKSHLTSELLQQVSMALEGSAKLGNMVFPIQCFRLCDGNRFRVDFRHELQPTQTSRGMLLFLGHGRGSAPDMQVRLFGACAVTKAVLNNVALQSLNEDNFILTFCPLRDGHNQLEMYTVPLSRSTYKVHLIVAAFVVTLV